MSLSILDSNFLIDPVWDEQTTDTLYAGVGYSFDVAWGPTSTGVYSTSLSCVGATIDTSYSVSYHGHTTSPGRRGIELGWSPDSKNVYLSSSECALCYWRITFPTANTYTLSLSGIGTVEATVASVPPALVIPTLVLLYPRPLNRMPSRLWLIEWEGTYPSGGLDLPSNMLGVGQVLWYGIDDTATYRFSYSPTTEKLKVFDNAGEVSGSISFSTNALFIGAAA